MNLGRCLFALVISLLIRMAVPVCAQRVDERSKRTFFVVEGTDAAKLVSAIAELRNIGKNTENLDEVQAKLASVGKVSIVRLSGYSVFTITVGNGSRDALKREVAIPLFKGSPYGLLRRLTKETRTNWDVPRFYASTEHGFHNADFSTAIRVENFRGTVRQLLMATIPPSYASLAFSVRCKPDGSVEVRHIGQNQFPRDQFPTDRKVNPLPQPILLTADEQEVEGVITARRKVETEIDLK